MFLAIAEYVKWGPKCRLSDWQTYSKKHPFIIDGSREYKVAKFSKIPRTAESAQGWQQTLRQRTEWNSVYIHYMYTEWQSGKWIEQGGGKTQVQSRQRKWKGSQIRLEDTKDLFCIS